MLGRMSLIVVTLLLTTLLPSTPASAATDEANRIGVDLAHDNGFDGTGRTVAVITGGIDTNHPALDGAIVSEACFSDAGSCPDDGDSDPTDAHGPGAAYCRVEFDEACDYGTFVTSILAGGGGGGTRTGVAPQADVVAVRIDPETPSLDDLTAALQHLAEVDDSSAIDAIVLIAGGQVTHAADCDGVDPNLTAAIAELRSRDVALVAEAGFVFLEPDARVIPGCVSGVTAVLSADGYDHSTWIPYTHSGSGLAAPSYEIRGAAPGGASTTMNGLAHQPFVAGTMALLRQQDSSRSVAWMEQHLFDTGAHLSIPSDPPVRRVDVGAALGLRTPQAQAVWVITSTGAVHARGDAPDLGGASGLSPGEVVVAGAPTSSGGGYWLATNLGRVVPRGDAAHHGDMFGRHLNSPIVAMAATNSGDGYWLLGRDGGIFTFGGADFYGSTGGMRLNAPVTDLAPTPTGAGYWLTAMDGGVFTFGDGKFHGSTGSMTLNQPVVSIAAQPERGYWLVALDGGVFTFGDPLFHGSLPTTDYKHHTGIRIRSSADGRGYHIATREGRIMPFGAASYFGPYLTLAPGESVVELIVAPE